MTEANAAPIVWGMFNGERGNQVPALHPKGPFPPSEGSEGWIAIGWPAIGSLTIWKDDHRTYLKKFALAYPGPARVMTTQANMPWNFAFEMKEGDWVICPCSSKGLLLIGKVIGDYQADWDEWKERFPDLRCDFIHFRQVRWLHVIQASDARHGKLNRIGQQALSRQRLTVEELLGIVNGVSSADARSGSLFGAHRGSVRVREGVDLIDPVFDELTDAETGRELEH